MIHTLLLATGLTLIAFAPRFAAAADNTDKLAEKEKSRLAEKCAKEAAKDLRDAERGRTHPRPDNKWDELCAPPPPPVEPPAVEPPVDAQPAPMLPPGMVPPPAI